MLPPNTIIILNSSRYLGFVSCTVRYQPFSKCYCCWHFLSSHLRAWLHWNPTQHKRKRLPHAPLNNSVTHLPFMKPASTLIVLQLSFTYETVPVSLRLGWSVHFIWFRASRIIKHLQHDQRSHVQNGGGELFSEEPLDPDQASMLGICFRYRPHCLLPWQQTEISLLSHTHTFHPSAFQHCNHPPLSASLSPGVATHFSAPSIPRVWGIHFNWSPADERSTTGHVTNSDVSDITASFLLAFQARSFWAQTTAEPVQPEAEWIELTNTVKRRGAQCRPGCATGSGPLRRSAWPPVKNTVSVTCFDLFQHMSRENIFLLLSPHRNRLSSGLETAERIL